MKEFVARFVAMGPLRILVLAVLDGIGVALPGGVDLAVVFLAAANPSQAYFYAATAVAGSLAGGVALFMAAQKGGEALMDKHTAEGRGRTFKLVPKLRTDYDIRAGVPAGSDALEGVCDARARWGSGCAGIC